MAKKIDLNTIAKEYAEGRISKEDFLYLHKMLTDAAAKQSGQSKAAPPVLKPAPGGIQQTRPRPSRPPQSAMDMQQRNAARARQSQQLQTQAPAAQYSEPDYLTHRRSVLGYIKSHHKEVVALLGTLGIFISMFYNKFDTTAPDTDNARLVVVEHTKKNQSPRIRSQDIKLIAQLMMEDNSWSKELIDDFVAQWNRLSENEKHVIKQTDWYLDFSSMLSQQIKTTRIKAKTGDVAAIYDQQALLALADSLIFGNDPKAKDLLAEAVKSAKTEQSSDNVKRDVITIAKDTPKANKEPRELSRVNTAKISVKPDANSQTARRHRISRIEIEDIVNHFTVAFEAGHTRDLFSLFADDDYSSSFASLDHIKSEYRELFRETRDRQLDLDSFFWEHDYGEARGTAKYKAKVKMKDSNVEKTITADLNITIRRLLGKNYITNFEFKNRKVVSSAGNTFKPEKTIALASRQKPKELPKHPTPAELQDLVTQYVTAYETGDVNELMHLFANATWTTSRSGLVEMKQNYDNLFASTSGREVFIKGMKWKFKGKKALGTGDLLVTLHTKDKKVTTQKGKIRVVATKSGDTVRFTQMFHIVD